MERIKGQLGDQKALAQQVLAWTTCARRPLGTQELQHALAVELGDAYLDGDNLPEIEDIVSVCAGLVTVNNDIAQFIHHTTQQYFEHTWESWFPYAHRDIGNTCVTYLSFETFEAGFCQTREEYEAPLHDYPLYKYAAQNWGYHCRFQSREEQLILSLLRNERKRSASTQSLLAGNQISWKTGSSRRVPMQMMGIHLAAYFGLTYNNIVKQLGNDDGLYDIQDSFGRTPLS